MAPFMIMIGLLAGMAGRHTVLAAAIAAPLLGGLQYVLAGHTRATRDRERTQGLFEARFRQPQRDCSAARSPESRTSPPLTKSGARRCIRPTAPASG
jgi:hypothetical protein